MAASGLAWLAETRAPVVTMERPMRPEIGALTLVNCRLISADCTPARARSTAALAASAVDCASSRSCLLTTSAFASSPVRSARMRAASRVAIALVRSARAWFNADS